MRLCEFTQPVNKTLLVEGGNLQLNGVAAQRINLENNPEFRKTVVKMLMSLLGTLNAAYQKMYKEPLWSDQLLQERGFVSGSSKHFFNLEGIPDQEFAQKKKSLGDIDLMIDKTKEQNIKRLLDQITGKTLGNATLIGYKPGSSQVCSLWSFGDPKINIQIDIEMTDYYQDKPTPWSQFSHSSSWDDIQLGIKGVFHKFLIQSLTMLTQTKFLLRKMRGRGKARAEQDVPTEDKLYTFSITSKEGGGLRAKYEPVLDQNGKPLTKDGLMVMRERAATGYEKNINKIFQNMLGQRLENPDKAHQYFWSYIGLLKLLSSSLTPEEKQRVLNKFLEKTLSERAHGLYRNDYQRDMSEKNAAIDLLLKTWGMRRNTNINQLQKQYASRYKIS
jgi:hypothetical protein